MSHPPSSAHPTGVYARAQTDPEFLERVRAAYTGRAEVLDALWWHDHPAEVSPSGAEAPQVLVRQLQRLAYAADSDPAPHAEDTRRLNTARRVMDEDRAAIERAISSAESPAQSTATNIRVATAGSARVRVSEHRELGHSESTEPSTHEPPEPGPSPADADPRRESSSTELSGRHRGRAGWIAAGLLAALIAGLIFGSQWDGRSGGVPLASPGPGTDPGVTGFAEVFDRTQNPYTDVPPIDLPIEFNAESSARELFHGDGSSVYAVKTRFESVCVVAIPPELTLWASCVPSKEFPASGLTLNWSSESGTPDEGGQMPETYDWTLTWLPDGTVEPAVTVRSQEISPQGTTSDPFSVPDQTEDELARLIYPDSNAIEGSVSVVVPEKSSGLRIVVDCRMDTGHGGLTLELSPDADPVDVLTSYEMQCGMTTGLEVWDHELAGTEIRARLVGELDAVTESFVIVSNIPR